MQARRSKLLKLVSHLPNRTALQEIHQEEPLLLARLSKRIREWTAFLLRADKTD